MRLVIWNCLFGLGQEQATSLAALRPDIAVILEDQEVLAWPLDAGPPPSTSHWIGHRPDKGIRVLSFGDWKLTPSGPLPRLPWALSMDVSGPAEFRLVAVWTVRPDGAPDYPVQVAQIIEAYRPELEDGTTVLAGDFNCSGDTANPRPHLKNVATLREIGMESAFHGHHHVEPGDEPMGTLYWRWSETARYHCDLGFVPTAWVPSIKLGRSWHLRRLGRPQDQRPRPSDHRHRSG